MELKIWAGSQSSAQTAITLATVNSGRPPSAVSQAFVSSQEESHPSSGQSQFPECEKQIREGTVRHYTQLHQEAFGYSKHLLQLSNTQIRREQSCQQSSVPSQDHHDESRAITAIASMDINPVEQPFSNEVQNGHCEKSLQSQILEQNVYNVHKSPSETMRPPAKFVLSLQQPTQQLQTPSRSPSAQKAPRRPFVK